MSVMNRCPGVLMLCCVLTSCQVLISWHATKKLLDGTLCFVSTQPRDIRLRKKVIMADRYRSDATLHDIIPHNSTKLFDDVML